MTADVFVTGGSGLVGGALMRGLVEQERTVAALVRSPEAAAKVTADGAIPVHGDLFDEPFLASAMWGVRTVFHVAGVNQMCGRGTAEMDRVNIDGSRSVIRAAAESGVGRVVYTSSGAAIGESEGMIGSEATAHNGEYVSRYARSKHLAEQAVLETSSSLGVDTVVVSPSSVQGPGRTDGSAKILLYGLNAKRPFMVDTEVSFVDIDDCTAGHIAAADLGRAGERYLLSSGSIRTRDAVSMAARIADREIRPRWLSGSVIRTLVRPVSGALNAVAPGVGVCPELIATLLHGHRFDGSRAERDLGVTYTPLDQMFEKTILWFQSEGLLRAH